jgi:predicted DNA binding CopG/RHH family protein
MTVAQPRFDTEVKIPEYDVDVKGKKVIQLTDEEGKEKKKFLTASQTKVYNEILRKTFTSFVSKMDVDLRESLSETEKKDFADFLLKKAEKIAALQYIADNNSRIKKIVKKRIINSEKAIIKKISEDGGMPYEKLKSKINNALEKTFPKIFEDPQENE